MQSRPFIGLLLSFISLLEPSSSALAATAEVITLPAGLSDQLAVFRDTVARETFYFAPIGIAIVKDASGRPALGIQLFKPDPSKPNWTAAITLSIKQEATQAQIAALAVELSKLHRHPNIQNLGSRFNISLALRHDANAPISVTKLEEGEFTAGATLALHFEITGTGEDIKAGLSGISPHLIAIFLDARPNIDRVIQQTTTLETSALKAALLKQEFLSVEDWRGNNSIVAFVLGKFAHGGVAEEALVREWLLRVFGPPRAQAFPGGAIRLGWDLADTKLINRIEVESSYELRSEVKLSDGDQIISILDLGNLCETLTAAIVNLEDGSVGCDSIK